MKAVHRGAPGRPDLHSLLDAAGVLAAELRQLRGHFEALTGTYTIEDNTGTNYSSSSSTFQ